MANKILLIAEKRVTKAQTLIIESVAAITASPKALL